MDSIIHSIQNVHLKESKIDEEDSYHFLNEYLSSSTHFHKYSFPPLTKEEMISLVSNFSFFCAKIKDSTNEKLYSSNIPLTIFRYLLLPDDTWSHYYTVHKKQGRVVEGMQWSNGLFYQIREDTENHFEVYEIVLLIDSLTKTMYNFP